MLLRRGRAHNLLNMLRSWERDLDVLREAIVRVRSPVLLIWGTQDGAVDLRAAETLERILPCCKTVLMPGVGHLPFEENPEGFDRLVLDFLARSA
jgi:pimeloyl-ACP methyl ester carboxylesterase